MQVLAQRLRKMNHIVADPAIPATIVSSIPATASPPAATV